MKRYYFDWAATAPLSYSVLDDAVPFGNPSSIHSEGRAARAALEDARARCAAALGVKPQELVFTSGGTESNALVLFSLLCKPRGSAGLLYNAAEHPSVRENAAALEHLGIPCAPVSVEADGRVSETALEKALAKAHNTMRMAAIMAVNNETGAINDINALSAVLRRREEQGGAPIHFHCDAVQAAGKFPLDFYGWNIDSASISAHKLGAPCGIGLLWLRRPLVPLYRGGAQERMIRPGTENTQGALLLARALEQHVEPVTNLKNGNHGAHGVSRRNMEALISSLREIKGTIILPFDRKNTDSRFSPYILQCAFRNSAGWIIPGEVMARALDDKGFAVSTGSACSSANKERPVLDAMGIDKETSLGGIRISQGFSTTIDDINALVKAIGLVCEEL